MSSELTQALLTRYEYLSERPSCDCAAVNCPLEKLTDFLKEMRDLQGFDMLMDVTAIDWENRTPRFEVVYHIFSSENHKYLRVAANCSGDVEEPHAPSVVNLWAGAGWHERETYDMFGIIFDGHPDLRRILMWDDYPYFPLRKEFPLAGHAVELPAADVAERTGEKVRPAPMMGGPFHSAPSGVMSESEPRARDQSWSEAKEKPAQSE